MQLIYGTDFYDNSELFVLNLPTKDLKVANFYAILLAVKDLSELEFKQICKTFKVKTSDFDCFEKYKKKYKIKVCGKTFGMPIIKNGDDFMVCDYSVMTKHISLKLQSVLETYTLFTESEDDFATGYSISDNG